MKKVGVYLLSLALTGLLFYLAFKDFSFDDLLTRFYDVNYWWVLLSVVLALISHVLRSIRWGVMLEPIGHQVSAIKLFYALMSGYLANLALPRFGEVVRCGILKKNDGVPISMSFGTVVVERLLDLIILLLLVGLDVLLEFDKIFEYFKGAVKWEERGIGTVHIVLFILLVIVLGGLGIYAFKEILNRDFENPFLKKVSVKLRELVSGFLSIKNIKKLPLFVVTSIGIWICYFLMSYVIFFSIPETSLLGFGAGLSILAAAGVAMAMPVQGGVGAYHIMVSGVLIVYGVQSDSAIFFATLLHTSQVIFIMVFGGGSLFRSLSIKKSGELANAT